MTRNKKKSVNYKRQIHNTSTALPHDVTMETFFKLPRNKSYLNSDFKIYKVTVYKTIEQ